ncbi:PepSY domain-containing protein [uncultured Limosilactobacillus sp.]|uniref:PepSY domain-containing protein n=1 Tax=uncultured Limosilactobacillus sp. TaxID=2837629 RepID=UPI0025980877|nr:PepSY domain-containing protein [uncultured Limosilactobacillus sp.]
MTKQHSLKSRLVRLMAVTVLTTSVIGGVSLATSPTVNAAQAKTQDIKISQKQAVKKFQKEFKNAKISEITLEPKGNRYQYQIDGFDKEQEHTAAINAKTGKITWSHSNKLDKDDGNSALDLKKTISRKTANKLAEKEAKQGQGQKWTLENDEGKQIWEVEVVDSSQTTEVKINALNQDIISSNVDH